MENIYTQGQRKSPIFLVKTALVITSIAVVLLAPFSFLHFQEGRNLLGFISLSIVLFCAINSWNCLHNRYQPLLILLGLVPCILISLVLLFRELGVEGMLWSYPAALSFYFILPERHAWIANSLLLAVVVPEAWFNIDSTLATRFAATLLMTSIFAGTFITYISKQQHKLETLAVTDPLTGLFNRSLLHGDLNRAIKQSKRRGIPMSLLMIDIDHFKTINDSFGHSIGDSVLHEVGSYFQKRVRASDIVYRIGGEEFVILLYDADLHTAHQIAEEIRKEISLLPLIKAHPVTVSIGIAQLQAGDDINTWMKYADVNLYDAKQSGRNQVSITITEIPNAFQQRNS